MDRARAKKPDRPHARVGRRDLLLFAAGLTACSAAPATPRVIAAKPRVPADPTALELRGPVRVWSWFDLPDGDPRSRELSGITWDPATASLYAVQDDTANVITLVPDAALMRWSFGPTFALALPPPLDLEGIARVDEGFVVCSEVGPRIFEVDRRGALRREVTLPTYFAEAIRNKSLESLAASPSGRFLFTTSEVALPRDGARPTAAAGTRVRLVRLDRNGQSHTEHAYATDAVGHEGSDYGIADVAAASDTELLVLERGWAKGFGNVAKIYRISLAEERASCLGVETLSEATPTLDKTLFADLGHLDAEALPAPRQPQASALLDNYEGLAFGPRLPNGKRSLIVVSDDNGRKDQRARVLVLQVG